MFTVKQLEALQAAGKIKGFTGTKPVKRQAVTANHKGSKIKAWITLHLKAWCDVNGYTLLTEYKFHADRKWLADWFIPQLGLIIEYEGLMAAKSRHTSIVGYSNDTEKYSQASIMGFKILRYTALNHKNILNDMERLKTIKKS